MGVLLAAVSIAALAAGSVRLRRRVLPLASGPVAALGALVIGCGLFVAAMEVTGVVGLLRPGWLALACVAAGALGARLGLAPQAPPARAAALLARIGGWEGLAVLVAVAPVVALWAARTIPSLRSGMLDEDSLFYHMPYAAHFAQSGSITGLLFPTTDPLSAFEHGPAAAVPGIATFYPMNAALFHAAGIVFLGSDLVSPLLNLLWLGGYLLACWCFGEAFGRPRLALAAGALVAATPALAVTQAAEATDDIVGLFFATAAAALIVHARPGSRGDLLAAVAAGLAIGTKFSFVGPALALALAYVWLARRPSAGAPRAGWARVALWLVTLAAFGGFWYLRNLIAVGNPVPPLDLALGPIHLHGLEAPVTRHMSQAIAHFATDWTVWRTAFIPALGDVLGLGFAWPLLLGLAAVGAIGGAFSRGGPAARRAIAIVAIAAGVAYFFTPVSAGGARPHNPGFFYFNLRHASVALTLALLSLVALPWLRTNGRRAALAALLAAMTVATVARPSSWPARHDALLGAGWTLALVAALTAVSWLVRRPAPRRVTLAAVPVVACALLVVGAAGDVDTRYRDRAFVGPVNAWAAGVHDRRIGIVGTIGLGQYPLFGRDDSNDVRYIGRRTDVGDLEPVRSCEEWRTRVDRGRYDYLVVSPSDLRQDPIEAHWTDGAPAARAVLRVTGTTVYRLTGPLDPRACR